MKMLMATVAIAAATLTLPALAQTPAPQKNQSNTINITSKAMIATGTLALAPTSSFAADEITRKELAEMFTWAQLYVSNCNNPPAMLNKFLVELYPLVDQSELQIAIVNENVKLVKTGKEKWCELMRPYLEKAAAAAAGQK